MQSNITAIGVANPLYRRAQHEIAELIAAGCYLKPSQKKVLKAIYKASGIEYRHSVIADYCRSPSEFEFFPNNSVDDFPTTLERMKLYQASALPLAIAAIDNCLKSLDHFDKKEITHLITISCTGMYAPGIDIEIIQQLQLNPSTKRTAINFMGCYGAFNGLKVADAFCKADPNSKVLMVCIELCTLHFQNDFSLENVISNAIFADGAAAVLVEGATKRKKRFKIESFHSDLVPQTEQEMAWSIGDYGFDIILSSYVPQVIKFGIAVFTEKLLQQSNWSLSDIDYYAIHPGGLKILQACEESLNISPEDNQYSYQVLRDFGNMSSATVLFVLKNIWDNLEQNTHEKNIFSCAFGPGLTLEAMLLKAEVNQIHAQEQAYSENMTII
ncbi:type III polyketide synthase [Legionella maioricensis]|uniref:Type III polyketide synthase n=1 Tax=Legionella maioricensis TaxID=2896528 RepID=A0A9X2D1R7_9GAMM|nr:type III polyketide synthase [Legionella maioricensis]MCL9684826.1 type III polyketide synthase [Legionella maioricensis]MCL9688506.1 type III polyketide synthase [Legionella maioricensis]